MRNIISQGKSFLSFPDDLKITHRWQTIGLLVAPEENNTTVLNYFRVFISANTKDKIIKFVEYLEGKSKDGKAIQIIVRKLNEIPFDASTETIEYPQYTEATIQEKFEQANASNPDFLIQTGDVSIGIDRVHINTPAPYEIIYTIDPILPPSKTHTVEFSAENPYVKCEVQRGAVTMKLSELAYWQVWNPRDTRDIASGQPQTTPRIQKNFSGLWQAEFKGLDANNEFTFTYSRLMV